MDGRNEAWKRRQENEVGDWRQSDTTGCSPESCQPLEKRVENLAGMLEETFEEVL